MQIKILRLLKVDLIIALEGVPFCCKISIFR